jgi:hypothetical protein
MNPLGMTLLATRTAHGLRKDGTLGLAEEGRPVAMYIKSISGATVEQFGWSDGTEGPADTATLLPVKPPILSMTVPLMMTLFMLAGVAAGLAGMVIVPFSYLFPKFRARSNCFLHAFGHYWRDGAYVVMLPSLHGWWPHCVSSMDLRVFEEYYPIRRKEEFGQLKWKIPPIVFSGHVLPWVRREPYDGTDRRKRREPSSTVETGVTH